MPKTHDSLAVAIGLMLAAPLAGAQPAATTTPSALRAAVEQAVTSNPEVTSRFNALRAAGDAVDVARGAWFPRVDLQAAAAAAPTGSTPDHRKPSRSPRRCLAETHATAVGRPGHAATKSSALGHEQARALLRAARRDRADRARSGPRLLRRAALPPPGAAGRRQLRAAPLRVRRRSSRASAPASAAASTSNRRTRASRWPNRT